jgi:hypothetical protein
MWFDWPSERVFLICHTKKSPDPDTWSAACRATVEGLSRPDFIGTLVLTDGGGPSSVQREELAQISGRKKYKISVVSNASIVRFMVSSIALFNPEIQSFLPADWRKGLMHLGVPSTEVKKLERAIRDIGQRPTAERFAVLNSVVSSIR